MKNKDLFRKTRARFLVESTKIKNATFPYESALPDPMLRKMKWGVQNGCITKKKVLPVATLFS